MVCAKRSYPNQGAALAVLRRIQRLNLPQNRQQRTYWCDAGCDAWHLTSQPPRGAVDLADPDVQAYRQELRIYETPDVARAAVFVAIEVADVGGRVAIPALAARWRQRYARHDRPNG